MKKIFTPKQKAHVALEAIKGLKNTNELASEYEVHPIQIGIWKKALTEHAEHILSRVKPG
jgi:transposase